MVRGELLSMRTCRYCNKEYPETYFGVALTIKDKIYKRHKCKFCYHKTKVKLKHKYRDWIVNLKKNSKCIKCGNIDYRVLDFHHRNHKEKDFSISMALVNNYGLSKIRQEIKKCDILCANCHRILHWEERR